VAPRERVVGIIPARYGASRFPGKPLVPIAGKPMILHVAERAEAARQAGVFDRALVATDDERIRDVVAGAGFEVWMTSPEHPTGTDRLAEVARRLDAEIVCNVQGDEPLIEAETLRALVAPLLEDPELCMGTLKTRLDRPEDRFDPNRGKVVTDERDRALTFTRLPIIEDVPVGTDYFNRARVEAEHARRGLNVFSDIGVYAYRREFLLRFAELSRTPFEQSERLEQLRALEHGYEIAVPTVSHRALEVDTPEDLERVEAALRDAGPGEAEKAC
jgi:3-deoxy-manno-octulosonate cytidylyltransferase (CMP-KDO synthetase)